MSTPSRPPGPQAAWQAATYLPTDRVRLHRRGGPLHPWIPGLLDGRTSPHTRSAACGRSHVGTGGWARCSWWSGSWRSRCGLPQAAAALCDGRPAHRPRAVRAGRAGGGSGRCSSQAVRVPGTFVALPGESPAQGAAVLAVPRGAGIAVSGHRAGVGTARTFGDFKRPPFRAAARQLPERPRGAGPAGARGRRLGPRCAGGAPTPGAAGLPQRLQQRLDRPGPGPDRAGARRAGGRGRPSHGGCGSCPGRPTTTEPGFRTVSTHRLRRRFGDLGCPRKPADEDIACCS